MPFFESTSLIICSNNNVTSKKVLSWQKVLFCLYAIGSVLLLEAFETSPNYYEYEPTSTFSESYNCPKGPFGASCNCTTTVTNCSAVGLRSLPDQGDMDLNIQSIDLTFNFITSIDWNYFLPFIHLKSINITGNKLDNITYSNDILPVTSLYIDDCDLNFFNFTSFCNVKILYASGNRLVLSDNTFTCMQNLQEINLSNNTFITLSSIIFNGLDNLQVLNLAGNPWMCDCSLIGLRLFLQSLIAADGRLQDENNTLCSTNILSSPTKLMSLNIFEYSLCGRTHHSNRPKRSSDIPFQWQIVCPLLKTGLNIKCGPSKAGSCVYDFSSQSYAMVQYNSEIKSATSMSSCRNLCHENGAKYFVYASLGPICLCGDLNNKTACADCSSANNASQRLCNDEYVNIPGAASVFYDFTITVTPSQPEVMSKVNFHMSGGPSTYDNFTWNFSDGVISVTSFKNISHIYTYPDSFKVLVTLYSSKVNIKAAMNVLVIVKSQSETGVLACPSLVNAADKLNISATFTSSWKQKVTWSKENFSDNDSRSSCGVGWTQFRHKCIQLKEKTTSITLAHQDCVNQGGQLLQFNSEIELDEIKTVLQLANPNFKILTGAEWSKDVNSFVWKISNTRAFVFKEILKNKTDGDCVQLSSMGLSGTSCVQNISYVCEKGPITCTGVLLNKTCYVLVNLSSSWELAETVCQTNFTYGHLAVVPDASINSFIASQATIRPLWIGLKAGAVQGQFYWTNGEIFSGYSNLANKPIEEPCVSVNSSGSWLSQPCSEQNYFICQYDLQDQVNANWYVASTVPVFGNNVNFTSLIKDGSSIVTNTYSYILPASWFIGSGNIVSWNFLTKSINSSTNVALQIWRPVCNSKILSRPGCGSQSPLYSCQVNASATCADQDTCNSGQYYCLLTQTCKKLSEPCTCAGALPVNTTSCQNLTINTNFTLISTVNVTVPRYSTLSHFELPQGVAGTVRDGDVIGFQTESLDFVKCDESTLSPWQQPVMWQKTIGWQSAKGLIEGKNYQLRNNTTCWLNVVYAKGDKLNLPENLSFLKSAGNYTFALDTGMSKPQKCNVLALDAVGGIIWIYPQPARVNHSMVVVNVESGLTESFVVKILYGSDATAIWTDSKGEIMQSTRNTSCPIAIANNITSCKFNSSFLDAPYTIMQKKFSAGAVQTFQFQVSVINKVSSRNLTVVIHLYKLITGLEFHHSNCSDQAKCVLETGIAHTFFVSFKTGDVESMTFLINGVRIDNVTQAGLVYAFNRTGQFNMTVNVSNPLSWKTSTLTVFASARANFTTIHFNDVQERYAMGYAINISARAPFSEGASVNITWKFGTETFSSPAYSSDLSTLYTFKTPGVTTISLTLTDAFQEQTSASVTVFIYKSIQKMKLDPGSNVVATNKSFNLSISIGDGLQDADTVYGNITYTVDWGDGSGLQTWVNKQPFMLASHFFNRSGAFSVNATVYSDLEMDKVINSSVDMAVQDSIAGLTLHYDGPKHVSEEISFTVNFTKGSFVLFFMDFGDGLNTTVFQNSSTFPHTYSNASVYEAKVTARNLVSQVTHSLTLFAYDEHLLQIIKLMFPQCVPVNTSVNISTEVAAQSPGNLWYQWQLGNGETANKTGLQKTSTIYQRIGNYNVSLTVDNVTSSKSHSLSRTICVQEVISGLSVNLSNPVAFNQSLILEVVPLVAMVTTGSNMTYSWDVDNSSNIGAGEVLNLKVTQPRNYSVALRVSNSISKEDKAVTVQVLGIITGLNISCRPCSLNTYAKTATNISLTAYILYGNLETYTWSIDNVTDFIQGRSIEYTFPTAGNYIVTVVSENAVSKQMTQMTIVAQNEISGVNMTATPMVGQVNQRIFLQASWISGTDIAFDWACDSVKLNSTDSNATQVFTAEGPHTCTVEVYNNISRVKMSLQLQTLSLITNLLLNHNLTKQQLSPVMYATVGKLYDFTSFTNTEYMVLFQWHLQLENYTTTYGGRRFNYTFSDVGTGTITLMASNDFSQKNVTLAVAIQEEIRNVRISTNISAAFNTGSPLYVFVGATVMFNVSLTSGSNFSSQWYQNRTLLNPANDSKEFITLNFVSTGIYTIEVSVSNAISSGKSSLELWALEPVSNVSISKDGATNFPYFRTGSSLNLTAPAVKGSKLVYNWSISSDFTGQIFTTNLSKLYYSLQESGTFKIKLEVRNPLNSENDEVSVIVQGAITRLNISLKDNITPTGVNVNLSAVVNPDSTNVSYTWNISGEIKYGANVNLIFYQPGVQNLLLSAANKVSNQIVQDSIYALDPIENLTILDCNVPQQVQKLTPLKSATDRGTNVSFTWIFGAQNNTLLRGQTVSYVFPSEGNYNIYLIAENAIDKKSVSCSKKLFYPVGQIVLKVSDPNPDYIFQNQNVTFKVTSGHLWLASFEWRIAAPLLSTYTSVVNTYTTSFPDVGNYTISVNVSNGISQNSATLKFTVKECLCYLPKVTVLGDSSRTYKQSSVIELEVGVETKSCILYLAQHKWAIYQSNDCSNLTEADQMNLGSTTTTSLKLILQPSTLAKGTYCVLFSTGYRYTSVSESAFFKLNIIASGIKAIIKGGTSRTVALGSELCMDGSLSFNPDNPSDNSLLRYTWQCLKSNGTAGCFPEKTVQRFCYQDFQPGSYIFILQVEVEGHEPGIAEQLVTVLNDSSVLPMVSIVCESCARRGSFRVSASQTVALSAACENCPCQPYFTWTIFEEQVKITPSGSQSPTGQLNPTLLLTKWGVIKDHHTYTFVLDASCQKDFSKNGSATLELLFNLPPSGGNCTFTPTEIIPLQNQVIVSCFDWVDVDDPGSSIIYSIYVDSQNKLTHQNRSYLLYTGTSQYQSVFLAAFSDETVVLRVMVSDVYGASALGGSSSIQFTSPILPTDMTVNDYLSVQTDTMLSALIKQGNAMSILQFAIALGYGLNRESKKEQEIHTGSTTERLSEQKRAAIRDALAICLSTSVPLSTLEDVQQMAYALRMLTDYSDEFITEDSQQLITMTLTRMQNVLTQALPAAQSQEDIPVDDIAAVISNLLKAVNTPVQSSTLSLDKNITIDSFSTNFRNLTPEISTAVSQMDFRKVGYGEEHRKSIISAVVPFLEVIIVASLQTTVMGGDKIKLEINNITLQGQRCYAMNIDTYNTAEHIQFNLGPDILTGEKQKHDEVLQVWINYRQNPYTYGYLDFSYDKMPVQTISFYETNGSYIKLSDLSESDSVKINMMSLSAAETSYTSSAGSSSHFDEAQTNLSYSAVNILPKKSKLWQIPNTISTLQKGVGVHIQLRIEFLPNDTSGTNVKGSSVNCYLGLNYSPSSSQHTEKLVLTSEMMETGTDHRLYTFFNNKLTSADKLYITATNNDSYHTVKLSVATYYSFCQYFDTANQQWAQDGCMARDESVAVNVSCQCNHLTSFGGGALVSIVDLDFADLADLDLTTNPVVFIAVAIIFCAYLIIAIICRYFDRMDLKRISRIPLCGRDGEYRYKITVVTGRQFSAGTSANVGIKLFGSQGKGQTRHLTKTGAFQRNCHDSFLVAFDSNLGEVNKILVWHDNTGLSPSWFLSHIAVQDVQTKVKHTFIVNSWLSLEMKDGFIQKTVWVADEKQLKNYKQQFSTVFYSKLAEMHTWLSVSNRPDHSRFTRVQRATCCLTCTYLYMGINAVWYGVFKTKSEVEADLSWSSFGWEEIIIALVSTIMVLPLLYGLSTLFKRTRFKESVLTQARRPSTAQTLEIDADIDLFSTSESCKTAASLGEWEIPEMERESTTDSLPITSKLKRTAPMLSRSNKVRSIDDATHKKMKKELWSKDSIMQNWPDRMPDWIEHEKAQTSSFNPLSGSEFIRKDININKQQSINKIVSNKNTALKRRKSTTESDDDFDQQLNQLTAVIDRDENRKKTNRLKNLRPGSKKDITEDLFNSDDDWVHEEQEQVVKDTFKPSHIRCEPELVPNIDRQQSSNSIIKRTVSRDKCETSTFYKGKRQSIVSFSSKTKTFFSGHARSMSLESQARPMKMTGCTLPPWCLYVTHAICFKLCLLSIILVLWYGYRFGASVALKWLASLGFSVFASILVVEPIKVILMTIIVKCSRKEFSDDDPSLLDITPAAETNELFKDVKFKPLGGFALLHAKEEGKKNQHLYTMIREAVMFMTMFALFLSIVYINYNSGTGYYNNYNIQNKLYNKFDSSKSRMNLSNLKSIHHFWDWSQTVMARVIHLRELDQSENFGILLGPAWLRQIRGEKVPCPVAWSGAQLTPEELDTKRCVDLSSLDPPNDPRGISWKTGTSNWTYYDSSALNMYSKFGYSLFYTGGGYTKKLGSNYNETLTTLKQLESENWIDHLTKAVFVEFILYSASTDLTSSGSVLVEFSVTGGLLVSTTVQSEKLLRYVPGKVEPVLVCQVIFLLFVLYLTVILFMRLHGEKLHYFLGLWNWIDLIICLMAWTNSILYLACTMKATEYINKYISVPSDPATLAQVVLMHAVYRYLHAFLVFLFCLKVARQIRYIRPLHKFYMTLSVSSAPLMGAFFIFIILLLSYAQLGYLVFGTSFQGYSSFQQSITALLAITFSKAVYLTQISQSFRILSPIFFTSFCFIAYGFLMGMTIAILSWSYKWSKSQLYYKTTLDMKDYEMIDFMIQKFKLITGMTKRKPPFRRVQFADRQSTSCPSTISSQESSQSSNRSSSHLFGENWVNPLINDPISNLHISWNKVLSLIEKVEEIDKYEDETTKMLKKVIFAWKSAKHSKQKRQLNRLPGKGFQSWQRLKNALYEKEEFDQSNKY